MGLSNSLLTVLFYVILFAEVNNKNRNLKDFSSYGLVMDRSVF